MRLSWCVGVGRSAGWLALAKDGDPLVYGPVDVTVGSPERLIYEGEISIGKGLERLPRISSVLGGNGVLCAAELLECANQYAPVKQFDELVLKAKNEPAFLAEEAAVIAAYRADHIEKAVAQGKPREEVEKEFDRDNPRGSDDSQRADLARAVAAPHADLARRHGVHRADMATDAKAFHGKECCDPVEGMEYQTRNCGFILHQGGRIEIYSRAHGDRYAYYLKLFDEKTSLVEAAAVMEALVEAVVVAAVAAQAPQARAPAISRGSPANISPLSNMGRCRSWPTPPPGYSSRPRCRSISAAGRWCVRW